MRLRPLEALNLAALAVLATVTLLLWRRLADPGDILLRFSLMGAFLAVIVFLTQLPRPLPKALQVAVDFYPAAFIPFVYESLGVLIGAARGRPRDDLLIAADRAILGDDVTVLLQPLVRPGLAALLYVAYSTYYFLPIVLGAALWRKSRPEARRFIFTLTVCFYISYAGYFTIPAFGPRTALADRHTVPLNTNSVARAIDRTINQLEHTKLDAFPSGHTMITIAVLIVAWRRDRRLFWWMLPAAALLVFSTMYCRYHYLVDVLAGILLAFATVPLGDRLYEWMLGRPRSIRPEESRSRDR
ncbi:MAG TPA: phosphatase PAP2 family protein [Thermoanaerobaculia bacterium]|nr:phosphatase PAP2 family protein [Thermoanaerobaculia bacterium]